MNDISDLPKHHLDNIKTKLRSTCMEYHNSKISNKLLACYWPVIKKQQYYHHKTRQNETYKTSKYFGNLLAPLSKSEFTITNNKEFVKYRQKQKFPDRQRMVPFDVASLSRNVPLEERIEIILKMIYINKEIITDIPKQEIKELLLLCTKTVHFIFNNEIYIEVDGVAMSSTLSPVLANIFMVKLETPVIQI